VCVCVSVHVCIDECKVTFNLYALAKVYTKKSFYSTKTKHFVIAMIMDLGTAAIESQTHTHIYNIYKNTHILVFALQTQVYRSLHILRFLGL